MSSSIPFPVTELAEQLQAFWIAAALGGFVLLGVNVVAWKRREIFPQIYESTFTASIFWLLALGSLCLANFIIPGLRMTAPGSGCFLVGVHHPLIPGVGLSTPGLLGLTAIVGSFYGNSHARSTGSSTRLTSAALLPSFWLAGTVIGSSCIGYPLLREVFQISLQGYAIISGLLHLRDITISSSGPATGGPDS